MGAAASVKALYKDAFGWFKTYMDTATYEADFNQMDKDHDGGVSYVEMSSWIQKKIDSDIEKKNW